MTLLMAIATRAEVGTPTARRDHRLQSGLRTHGTHVAGLIALSAPNEDRAVPCA